MLCAAFIQSLSSDLGSQLQSAQCGPASAVFLPLPAGPTMWAGTGCQSVHCWYHRKVQDFFSFIFALPQGMHFLLWCHLTFKTFVLQLWNDPNRGLVHRERKGNTQELVEQSRVVNYSSCTSFVKYCSHWPWLFAVVLGALLRHYVSWLWWKPAGRLCHFPLSCPEEQYVLSSLY